ncbi:unnamed protein product [Ixodes persulcatus]
MEHRNGGLLHRPVAQRSPSYCSTERDSWGGSSPVDDRDDVDPQPLDFSRKAPETVPKRESGLEQPASPTGPAHAFMHPFSDVMMSFGTAVQSSLIDRRIQNGGEELGGILPQILRGESPVSPVVSSLTLNQHLMRPQQPAFPTSGEPHHQRNGNKYTRPFKAYPRDPLSVPLGYYGLPVQLPLTAEALAAQNILSGASDQAYLQFRQHMLMTRTASHHEIQRRSRAESAMDTTPPSMMGNGVAINDRHHQDSEGEQTSPENSNSSSGGTVRKSNGVQQTHSNGDSKKRAGRLPDDLKDDAYWERRRKNNEAAKRSRDARRAKEDEIAIRAAFLEQENLKLKVEVTALKNEMSKLRCLLYSS